ncbi:MAG: TPM domain-containing protein [Clostridia bacterium]|nr:TPM domain-containing protein [Clostridia bacterium]
MKRFLLLIISLMILALPCLADGYIADNADLLGEATEAAIKRANDTLADKNGASIHIYTAESCDGDIEDFARGLFNSYGLDGRAVLLCVFKDDYYILRGAELDSVLSEESLITLLEEHLEPDFSQGLIDSGVRSVTSELATILNGVKKVDTSGLERNVFIIFAALIAIALILMIVLFIMRIVNSRRARLRRKRRRPNRR